MEGNNWSKGEKECKKLGVTYIALVNGQVTSCFQYC